MKCILLVTKSETVRTFRQSLIRRLLQSGNQVGVIAYDEEYRQETESMDAVSRTFMEKNFDAVPIIIT